MDLQGTVIRPPSEAGSILLQVSLGCTHNKCTFCGAYPDKSFTIKDRWTVSNDIRFAARNFRHIRKVFLCDGDALSLPQKLVESILMEIRETLPWVTRVASYGSANGLRRKSDAELRRLRELGLGMVYMGLESGDDVVLAAMNKGCDVASIVKQGKRIMGAGLKLNVTVINGLGGRKRSLTHARETARALNRLQPQQAAALSLMLIPGTPLAQAQKNGEFELPDPMEMVIELREMVAGLALERSLFLANHSSNHMPFRARMPRDRENVLRTLDSVLDGRIAP